MWCVSQMEVQVLVLVFAMLCLECVWTEDRIPPSDRHAVYWNSSNARLDQHLTHTRAHTCWDRLQIHLFTQMIT